MPASTGDAILSHIRDPADAARLADSARDRLLYRYAIPLYRHAADAGDGYAAVWLVGLLARRGDLDEAVQILRARADADDRDAVVLLAGLLARRGDLDGAAQILRARAEADDADAALWLGDLDRLRVRADAGDADAAAWLAGHGDLDGAAQILRARAEAGDGYAALWLAGLLAERGDLDGAAQILRARADLLIKEGRGQDAEQLRRFGLNPRTRVNCLRVKGRCAREPAAHASIDRTSERRRRLRFI